MSGVAADSGGAVSAPATVTSAVAAATQRIRDFFMVYSTGSCGDSLAGSAGRARSSPPEAICPTRWVDGGGPRRRGRLPSSWTDRVDSARWLIWCGRARDTDHGADGDLSRDANQSMN
ncbi:hypothetical protein GCM10027615_41790 [Plantactinospora veratri]